MSIKGSQFFVVVHGKPLGPLSFQELEKMELKSSDFIKISELKDFKELREIPELCELLSITHEPTLPQYFATMDLRLLAWAIDSLIVFALFCIFIFVPVLIFANADSRIQWTLIGLLSVFPIHFIMNVFMECSVRQGTFGKSILKVKVCDVEGLRITLGRSFLRNSCKILGFLSLGIGFFVGFFDRKQQCWHDKLARTLVIKGRLL